VVLKRELFTGLDERGEIWAFIHRALQRVSFPSEHVVRMLTIPVPDKNCVRSP
jgi:hypothetical protein